MAEPARGHGVSHMGFTPLEWRCASQRGQKTAYRRILGRGALKVGRNVRISEDVLLSALPLTFSIQVRSEGTGSEETERFGRLQYSPKDEISQDSAAQLNVELNIEVDDFDDLWTRGPSRVPQRIDFEIEGLRTDGRIWELDAAQYADFLIVGYAFDNTTIDHESSNAAEERHKAWEMLWQRLGKLENKIKVIGEVAIGAYAYVLISSVLLFALIEKSFGAIGLIVGVVVPSVAWIIIFIKLKSILNKDVFQQHRPKPDTEASDN